MIVIATPRLYTLNTADPSRIHLLTTPKTVDDWVLPSEATSRT